MASSGAAPAAVGATTTFAGTFPEDLFETWLKFERTQNVWKIPTRGGLAQRKKSLGEVSFCRGAGPIGPTQANLYLKRGGETNMCSMEPLVRSHPLAVGSTIYRMANKITSESPAWCHESVYNLSLT